MDAKSWVFMYVYPYRTARVVNIYYRTTFRNQDLYDKIPEEDQDNHIVAKYINADGEFIYVQFSDDLTIYGYALEKLV